MKTSMSCPPCSGFQCFSFFTAMAYKGWAPQKAFLGYLGFTSC